MLRLYADAHVGHVGHDDHVDHDRIDGHVGHVGHDDHVDHDHIDAHVVETQDVASLRRCPRWPRSAAVYRLSSIINLVRIVVGSMCVL